MTNSVEKQKSNVLRFPGPEAKKTLTPKSRDAVKAQFITDCDNAFGIPAILAKALFEELAGGTFENIQVTYANQ